MKRAAPLGWLFFIFEKILNCLFYNIRFPDTIIDYLSVIVFQQEIIVILF